MKGYIPESKSYFDMKILQEIERENLVFSYGIQCEVDNITGDIQ